MLQSAAIWTEAALKYLLHTFAACCYAQKSGSLLIPRSEQKCTYVSVLVSE